MMLSRHTRDHMEKKAATCCELCWYQVHNSVQDVHEKHQQPQPPLILYLLFSKTADVVFSSVFRTGDIFSVYTCLPPEVCWVRLQHSVDGRMDGCNLGDSLVAHLSFSDDNIKSAAQVQRQAGFFFLFCFVFYAEQILLLLFCCQKMSHDQCNIGISTERSEVNHKQVDLDYQLNCLSYSERTTGRSDRSQSNQETTLEDEFYSPGDVG